MFNESTALDWLFKVVVGVLGWFGVTLHNRVTSLEREKATKTELSTATSDLKDMMKEHREETRQGFAEIRSILLKDVK